MKNLFDIVSHFEIQGTISDIKPLGAGLINDTYKVLRPKPMPLITYCNASITLSFKM